MTTITTGQRIREVRQRREMSLRQFGKLIGVSAVYLSDIERGNRIASPGRLIQIADVLGVSVSELIRD